VTARLMGHDRKVRVPAHLIVCAGKWGAGQKPLFQQSAPYAHVPDRPAARRRFAGHFKNCLNGNTTRYVSSQRISIKRVPLDAPTRGHSSLKT